MRLKNVVVLFLIWSRCVFAADGTKESAKNSSSAEGSHLAFQGPRRAIAVPFWKKENAEITLKVVSDGKSSKNQYTPPLYEIRSAGLWQLEKSVQYCQNLSDVSMGSGAGQIKFQFKKKGEKKYELVSVVAEPELEKMSKCIDNQFGFQEKLDKEIEKRHGE